MPDTIALQKEIEAELRRTIEAGSQDPEDYSQLADMLLPQGCHEEAISLYRKALSLPLTNLQKAKVSVDLGWLFYEMGKQEQALSQAESARRLLWLEAEILEVVFLRGMTLALSAYCLSITDMDAAAEAARSALEWLERVMVEMPDRDEIASVYIQAARLQNLLGNSQKSITLCEKALQEKLEEADRLSYLIELAESLRLEKRFTEAEQAISEALRYVEADKGVVPRLYFTLALIQRSANRPADARSTFQRVLVELQSHPYLHDDSDFLVQVYWNLAAVYYDLGEYKDAAAAYSELLRYHLQDDSFRSDALLWLGHCYFVTGAYAEAREWYKKVLSSPQSSNQQKAEAQEGLAKTYYQSSDYEQAAREFEQVLLYYPEGNSYRPTVLLSLGNAYEGAGAYRKAQDLYEKVLALPDASDDDKASARQRLVENLGKLSYESKQYGEAAAAFEEALVNYSEDDPHRPNVLLWLGSCYEGDSAYAKARECYEQVVASAHASEDDKASAKESLTRLPHLAKKTLH